LCGTTGIKIIKYEWNYVFISVDLNGFQPQYLHEPQGNCVSLVAVRKTWRRETAGQAGRGNTLNSMISYTCRKKW
jgi:hypothetical protein